VNTSAERPDKASTTESGPLTKAVNEAVYPELPPAPNAIFGDATGTSTPMGQGWYTASGDPAGHLRWFDGTHFTDLSAPAERCSTKSTVKRAWKVGVGLLIPTLVLGAVAISGAVALVDDGGDGLAVFFWGLYVIFFGIIGALLCSVLIPIALFAHPRFGIPVALAVAAACVVTVAVYAAPYHADFLHVDPVVLLVVAPLIVAVLMSLPVGKDIAAVWTEQAPRVLS